MVSLLIRKSEHPGLQEAELHPGKVIAGRYEVEKLIGRGGMGAVYAVRNITTGKKMALKCVARELVQNEQAGLRMVREASICGGIDHRHVIDVFDAGEADGQFFIAMELLRGASLAEVMSAHQCSVRSFIQILLRAMRGVAAAHASGVIHRDLKPDNIFVCEGIEGDLDDPRVLDFGVSKILEHDRQIGNKLTTTGTILGTPMYMSSEQIQGESDVDARSDVYAMACILYEGLTGHVPFPTKSFAELVVALATEKPPDLADCCPDFPDEFCDTVMAALSTAREDRPESMLAFCEALTLHLAALPDTSLWDAANSPSSDRSLTSAKNDKGAPTSPLTSRDSSDGGGEARASTGVFMRRAMLLFGMVGLLLLLTWALSGDLSPWSSSSPSSPTNEEQAETAGAHVPGVRADSAGPVSADLNRPAAPAEPSSVGSSMGT